MKFTDFLMEASTYAEGNKSYKRFAQPSCPYKYGTPEHKDWWKGYEDAENDDEEERQADRHGGFRGHGRSGLREGEEKYIASAAYKANLAKVVAQMERLNSNIARHQNDFARTNQKNWGYAGDMARLLESLEQINEWMDEAQF